MKTSPGLLVLALLALCPWFPLALQAGESADFYSATVPVGDHSDTARSRAVRLGLEEVLVKLSGVSTVARRPEARDIFSGVNAYVVEYGYTTLDGGGLGLKVQYDRAGIDRIMRARELPIWPLNRPRMLVWLVADSPQGETAFVTTAQAEGVQRSLDRVFGRRGMPVIYPRYDRADQLNLPAEKALTLDMEAIASASARYPVEGWLVVRLHQSGDDQWRAAWAMGRDDQSMVQEVEAASLEELLQVVVDQSVDTLAANFSYVARKTADLVELDVQGVSSFRAYNNLINLLEEMSIIRTLAVTGLDGNRVRLVVGIEGERSHLINSLDRYPGIEALNPDGSASIPTGNNSGLQSEAVVDSYTDSPVAPQVGGVERLRWVGGR